MPAEGDDIIKGCQRQLRHQFGVLAGDVDAGLGHDTDRIRIHPVLFNAGGIGFDDLRPQVPCPALGHLTAARVAGAEEENGVFPFVSAGLFVLIETSPINPFTPIAAMASTTWESEWFRLYIRTSQPENPHTIDTGRAALTGKNRMHGLSHFHLT